MKSVLIASIITAYIFTAQDPQQTLKLQYKAYIIAQQFTPDSITKIKDRILTGKKIPRAAKQFMDKNIAWKLILYLSLKRNVGCFVISILTEYLVLAIIVKLYVESLRKKAIAE